jgi:hypothetical protein
LSCDAGAVLGLGGLLGLWGHYQDKRDERRAKEEEQEQEQEGEKGQEGEGIGGDSPGEMRTGCGTRGLNLFHYPTGASSRHI